MAKELNLHKYEKPLFRLLERLDISTMRHISTEPTFKERSQEIKDKYNHKF